MLIATRLARVVLLGLLVAGVPEVPAVAAQTPAAGPAASPTTGAAMPCGRLAAEDFSHLADATVHVVSAADVAANGAAPAYCKVEGTVASNARFVLQLPSGGWDGRYFESGCGGFCGSLNPNADCQQAFSRGGAIGYSDLGTTGMQNLAWTLDEGARLDFAYAANHQLAVAAKAIVAAYYGRPPAHNYFIGCSDGGREALMEAQRFPDDFDGIVAGAPAFLYSFLNSFSHAWKDRANADAAGNPIITAAKAAVLHQAVLAACDNLDGAADGLIIDSRQCAFDPATLRCPHDVDAPNCLTQAQVDAARRLYSPAVDADGVPYYPGASMPYGSELRWIGGGPPAAMGGPSITDVFVGHLSLPLPRQDTSLTAADLQFTPQTFVSLLPMAAIYDASSSDLTAFRDRGGKLILYHGWADDSIPPEGTIAYYAALQRRMGGLAATQRFARLFMFPGVYHCSGGYGPSHWDMVTPIAEWVEHGVAPAEIVATQYASDAATAGGGFANPTNLATPGGPPSVGATPAGPPQASDQTPSGPVVRTLPAFPYPLRPHYTGAGNVNQAQNWTPILPATPTKDDIDWIGKPLLGGSSQ